MKTYDNNQQKRTVLNTGGTDGIGLALAKHSSLWSMPLIDATLRAIKRGEWDVQAGLPNRTPHSEL